VRRRDKSKKNRDSERLSLPQLEQKTLRKSDFGAGAEREFQETFPQVTAAMLKL